MSAPPPQNTFAEIDRLYRDARVVKRAHFMAQERKKQNNLIFGAMIIIINSFISANIIGLFAGTSTTDAAVKILAFIATVFATLQTFFNFSKDIQSHLAAGNVYASIERRTSDLLAECKDNLLSQADCRTQFDALTAEFLKANTENQNCVPSNADYAKTRKEIKAQESIQAVQ